MNETMNVVYDVWETVGLCAGSCSCWLVTDTTIYVRPNIDSGPSDKIKEDAGQ